MLSFDTKPMINKSSIINNTGIKYTGVIGDSYKGSCKKGPCRKIHDKKPKSIQIGVSKKVGSIKYTEFSINDLIRSKY